MRCFALLVVGSLALAACPSAPGDPPVGGGPDDVDGDTPPQDAAAPAEAGTQDAAVKSDAGVHDAGVHDAGVHDAAAADLAPTCKKHLTVVFAVGTGAGAVGSLSNGCWDVVDADGAANKSFRKCSTGNMVVTNASAPNYAYDDTNPDRPLSDDQTFLSQCSAGATGEGYEYMAFRSGTWRLLTAPHMKAYFAELYSSDLTIDDYLSSWPKTLSGHAVSPMINIGPNDPKTIGSATTAMCNPLANGDYFGVYNGDWKTPMGATDARAKALAASLNGCTH